MLSATVTRTGLILSLGDTEFETASLSVSKWTAFCLMAGAFPCPFIYGLLIPGTQDQSGVYPKIICSLNREKSLNFVKELSHKAEQWFNC